MKKYILLLLGGLLARSGASASLPADTLRGQTQFVRLLSEGVCERLQAESQKNDLSKLQGEEAQKLLTRLMFSAMGDHLDEYQALMKQATGTIDNQKVGTIIGQNAMMRLVESCPAARPLLIQLGLNAVNKKAELSAAERPVLAPIAEHICQQLNDANAKQPFASMAPGKRASAIQGIMQQAMLGDAEQLNEYYGEDALSDESQMRTIGTKIGLLVFERCPSYIMLLGLDAQNEQAQATASAATGATPSSKKAAPPRQSVGKAKTAQPAPGRTVKK